MSASRNHLDLPERAKTELVCLGRTLMPDDETLERTVATIILLLVWAAMVLGPMFTDAEPPRYEITIGTTMVTYTVLGKMWDFEVQRALEAVPLPDGGQTPEEQEEE